VLFTNKEQLAKANCSIQGDTEKTKWILAYSLSTVLTEYLF